MTAPPVVLARGVSKRFASSRGRATQLKERVVRRRAPGAPPEGFWALRDVDVHVGEGETVGLIGPNGAGKSTLLKVLAGILRPTHGQVEVQGRVASLLELGAGFDGELTGRENLYLNGALLGLTQEELREREADIVAFAEQAPRMDEPVKHWSSGEYVRLAFSIAVHVDPDVLLVDEVLAVGDEAFARKCLARIARFQDEGRTILFVSHSLDLVERLCTRGIVVDGGRVRYDGDPAFAVGTLRAILGTDRPVGSPAAPAAIGGHVVHAAVPSHVPGGPRSSRFRAGETLHLRVEVEAEPGPSVHAGDVTVVFMGAGDIPVFSLRTPAPLPPQAGRYRVEAALEVPRLNGAFVVGVTVSEPGSGLPITARRFDEAVWVETGALPGLLDVPSSVEVVRTA